MTEPSLLTAAINWYRALPLSDMRGVGEKVTVPTVYVWGDGDTGLLGKGARECDRYVSGAYLFETLHEVSHWMVDERPDAVADVLLEWFAAHREWT